MGNPPILTKNGCKKGINIVGSTSILNAFHTIYDIYDAKHSITSVEIQQHIEYLLQINPNKKVVLFLDNTPTHKSKKIKGFFEENKEHLEVIYLPRYSPYMNPQENMWHYLKSRLFRPSARESVVELIKDAEIVFSELNLHGDKNTFISLC